MKTVTYGLRDRQAGARKALLAFLGIDGAGLTPEETGNLDAAISEAGRRIKEAIAGKGIGRDG